MRDRDSRGKTDAVAVKLATDALVRFVNPRLARTRLSPKGSIRITINSRTGTRVHVPGFDPLDPNWVEAMARTESRLRRAGWREAKFKVETQTYRDSGEIDAALYGGPAVEREFVHWRCYLILRGG